MEYEFAGEILAGIETAAAREADAGRVDTAWRLRGLADALCHRDASDEQAKGVFEASARLAGQFEPHYRKGWVAGWMVVAG